MRRVVLLVLVVLVAGPLALQAGAVAPAKTAGRITVTDGGFSGDAANITDLLASGTFQVPNSTRVNLPAIVPGRTAYVERGPLEGVTTSWNVSGLWSASDKGWYRVGGDFVDARAWGAYCDDLTHPLSSKFATLAAAQAVYPHATSLTQQIDWAAIQGAVNAYSTVLIPEGTCWLGTKNLTITGSKHLIGIGYGNGGTNASRILAEGTVGIHINDGSTGIGANYWSIENLVVHGRNSATYGIQIGINGPASGSLVGGHNGLISNVYITGTTGACLRVVTSYEATYRELNCSLNLGDGVLLDNDGVSITTQLFDHLMLHENTGRGLVVESGDNLLFVAPTIQFNDLEGVYMDFTASASDTIKDVWFQGGHIEANNEGRGAGGYAQFRAASVGSSRIYNVRLDDVHFITAGTGNKHLSLQGGDFRVAFPLTIAPADAFGEIGDPGSSVSDVYLIDWSDPGTKWTVHASATALWHRVGGGQDKLYRASAAAWVLMTSVNSAGVGVGPATATGAKLYVQTDSGSLDPLILEGVSPSTVGKYAIGPGVGGAEFGIRDLEDGVQLVSVDTSQRVGIGGTASASKVHIKLSNSDDALCTETETGASIVRKVCQGPGTGGGTYVWGVYDSTGARQLLGFDTNGQLRLPTTGSSAGIVIGGDVQLYRASADALALGGADRLNLGSGSLLFANGAEPTCDATYRGLVVNVQGAGGVADTLRMCMKSAGDTYSWKTIATG